eukprot:EG_transcript_13012
MANTVVTADSPSAVLTAGAFLLPAVAAAVAAGAAIFVRASRRRESLQFSMAAAGADVSRRAALGGGLAAATALLRPPSAAWAEDVEAAAPPPAAPRPKTVLITGSNSGIGLDGAIKLARRGDRVLLACRTLEKAEAARATILKEVPAASPDNVVPVACDLASLTSVRQCAERLRREGVTLDVLVLNAGVQFTGVQDVPRTADGFELTVGTNHLGHFLLANLLLPLVAPDGRIVVTASEVHDPKSPGGAVGRPAALGDLRGLREHPDGRFGMVDGEAYDAEKAYKDSKLCNILFAHELQRRLAESGSKIEVVAFGPGLITRTGFFRSQPPLFVKVFDFATNDLFRVAESVSGGGDCLVYMVETPGLPKGAFYNNQLDFGNGFGKHAFVETPVSEEATDDAKAAQLWDLSAKLVGL